MIRSVVLVAFAMAGVVGGHAARAETISVHCDFANGSKYDWEVRDNSGALDQGKGWASSRFVENGLTLSLNPGTIVISGRFVSWESKYGGNPPAQVIIDRHTSTARMRPFDTTIEQFGTEIAGQCTKLPTGGGKL